MHLPLYQSPLHKQLLNTLSTVPSQPTNLITPQQILSLEQLIKFKTQPCQFINNIEYHTIHNQMQHPYYYNCPYYHTNADKRRKIIQGIVTNKQNNNNGQQLKYLYRDVYIDDSYGEGTCQNWIQYLYHPLVYKTKQCDFHNCIRKYCPKFHRNQQPKQSHSDPPLLNSSLNLQKSLQQLTKIKQCFLSPQILPSKNLPQQLQPLLTNTYASIQSKIQKITKYNQEQVTKQKDLQTHLHNLVYSTTNISTSNKNNTNLVVAKQQDKEDDYKVLFYQEQLKIVEDRQHQFKMFKNKDPRSVAALVLEYVSAFLNSDGGSIYLGINNESIVHGIQVTQDWLDRFKLAVDSDGRDHLNPPLIPQKYDLRIIPVNHKKKRELKVIQVKVYPQPEPQKKILTLYKKQCYLRMNASNHRLSASDIMQYMRLVNIKKDIQILTKTQQKIDDMKYKQLKQMMEVIQRISNKIGQAIKKKEKEKQKDGGFGEKNDGALQI